MDDLQSCGILRFFISPFVPFFSESQKPDHDNESLGGTGQSRFAIRRYFSSWNIFFESCVFQLVFVIVIIPT